MSKEKLSRLTDKGLFILDKKTLDIQVFAPENVSKEEALKSLNEAIDNDGHELYINMVSQVNRLNNLKKELLVLETMLASFCAIADIYNLIAIMNHENTMGFLNYLISGGLTYVFLCIVKDIIKTIIGIIVGKPFLNSLNEYTKEHYPDEADKVNAPKTLRKLFKKKNEEKES